MMVTIRLLGPVSLGVGGQSIPVRSVRARSLLAALGLAQGRPIDVGRLVELHWGPRRPNTAVQQVHNTVSGLRRTVTSSAVAAGLIEPDWLRTGADGYHLGPDAEVDLTLFLDDLREAERAHAAGQPRRARDLIDRGLARWGGDALSGVSGQLALEAPRLEAHRRIARVSRIRLALEIGDAAALSQDAESLLSDDPFDEQLRVLVMRILHLRGRRKEAFDVYRDGVRVLREELGIDPSVQLREAYNALLGGSGGHLPGEPAPEGAPVPAQMPPAPGAFVGRRPELAELLKIITAPPVVAQAAVVVISGIGGVGKTALAVVAGHAATGGFPDGQVFVHLRGPQGPLDPMATLERVLRALGFTGRLPPTVDERCALLRTLTVNKAILIVVDDADSADQVRNLIPSEPRCAVVITARRRLPTLLWSVSLELQPLAWEPSRQLLAAVTGGWLPPDGDPDVETILRACAGLPLALTVAGARLKTLGPGRRHDLAQVLDAESSRLAALELGAVGVSETLAQGFSALGPDARRAVVAVAGLAGRGIPDWCILAACDANRWRALAAIDELMTAHLLYNEAESDQLPPRFGIHDLVRLHLRPRLIANPDGARQALETVLEWWLNLARAVSGRMSGVPFETSLLSRLEGGVPDSVVTSATEDPAGWARRNQHNLVAAAQAAIALERYELAVALVDASRRPLIGCWLQDACDTLTRLGLQAARRSSNSRVRGRALLARGSAFLNSGAYPAAARALWLAMELLHGVDWAGAAVAAGNLAGALEIMGQSQTAVRHCDRLLNTGCLTPMARSILLRRRGNVHASLGRLDAALSDFIQARRQLPGEGNWETHAHLLEGEARLYLKRQRPDEARSRLAEAIGLAREHGSPRVEGYLLLTLSEVRQACGDVDLALDTARRATRLMAQVGDQDGEALGVYRTAMLVVRREPATGQCWLARARTLLQSVGRPVELAAVERLLDGVTCTD